MTQPRKRTVILISGRGSNMAALIEAAREQDFPAQIVGVISDRADAPGLIAADKWHPHPRGAAQATIRPPRRT